VTPIPRQLQSQHRTPCRGERGSGRGIVQERILEIRLPKTEEARKKITKVKIS
jgi:hypothetical protein